VTRPDGRVRICLVRRDQYPLVWHILESFHATTGVPVLARLPLQGQDGSASCSIADAVAIAGGMGLGAVAVESFLLLQTAGSNPDTEKAGA